MTQTQARTNRTNQSTAPVTIPEIMIGCIARAIEDRELVAQGIATPLVTAGYYLAKRTHAPNVMFANATGTSLTTNVGRVSVTKVQELTIKPAMARMTFAQAACEFLPALRPKEFFRPGQVDRRGNFNNIVIGPWERPKLRLPGCAGIADVTVFDDNIYLYVPNHGPRVFVEKLDFRSGVGFLDGEDLPTRRAMGITSPGPKQIVTNLCVFGFKDRSLIIDSVHPGVTLDEVRSQTGFTVRTREPLETTPVPSEEELRILREEIDPLNIRDIEFLSGMERFTRLAKIVIKESGM